MSTTQYQKASFVILLCILVLVAGIAAFFAVDSMGKNNAVADRLRAVIEKRPDQRNELIGILEGTEKSIAESERLTGEKFNDHNPKERMQSRLSAFDAETKQLEEKERKYRNAVWPIHE